MAASGVLLTGSNRGIGLGLVKELLRTPRPPAWIFATCRDPAGPRAQELRDLASKHPNLVLVKLDVADPSTITKAVKIVEEKLNGKGLNLLINNAGICNPEASLETVVAEEMIKTYKTNVVGPLLMAQALEAEPLELSSTLLSSPADTLNLPSIRGAVQAVGSYLKDQGLNLLINNAGVSSHATLHSLDSQEMLSVFATNAIGPLQVAKSIRVFGKEFLPLLEKAAKGSGQEGLSCSRAAIINVSTKLGSIGLCLGVHQAPMYPYRTSKAAQNMVTRCLAAELQDKGILCTAIHPGWVKTDMGTEKAPLTVEHSVRGILTVLASLSQDTSGAFLDWEGNSLPW